MNRGPQDEAVFMAAVIEFARIRGWRWYHTRRSTGSDKGWPDLVLVRGEEMKLWELKVERTGTKRGDPTPEQQAWLDALGQVRFLDVDVIRPDSQWESALT